MGDNPEEPGEVQGPSIQDLSNVVIPKEVVRSDGTTQPGKKVAGYIVDYLAFGYEPTLITRASTGITSSDGSALNLREVAINLRTRLGGTITTGLNKLGGILTYEKVPQGRIEVNSEDDKFKGTQSTAIAKIPVYLSDGQIRFDSPDPEKDKDNLYNISIASNPNYQNPELGFPRGIPYQILLVTDNNGKSLTQKAADGEAKMKELAMLAASKFWNIQNRTPGISIDNAIDPLKISDFS